MSRQVNRKVWELSKLFYPFAIIEITLHFKCLLHCGNLDVLRERERESAVARPKLFIFFLKWTLKYPQILLFLFSSEL